ncbi:RNA polymerase sigma-70 factor [Mucilaginibacter gynuensis]|uniref:RNA polymerase sigma-70 factor n=1 Tax=Mucilaginibacter gynuensis TaxID=1302236 RepID=A0ABP8GFG9_9SPHI
MQSTDFDIFNTAPIEKKAFTEFYARHFQTYTLLAFQYVKDTDVAEDIVQDVFIKFWEAPFNMDNPQAIKSYFGKIVINNSLNYLKREKNIQRHHDQIGQEITEQDAYAKLHETELKVILYKEIELLPEQCKRVFKMNRFEGLKYREIAEMLNISERTVENHISNALKTLRKRLYAIKNELGIDLLKHKAIILAFGLN